MNNASLKMEGSVARSHFGSLEHQLAEILSRAPWLKQRAKRVYQTINFHLYKKKHLFLTDDLPITRIGNSIHGEFFGYFQNSPERNGQVAYLAPKKRSLNYQNAFPIDVIVDGKKVSHSTAWNWQQGCMLWWKNDQEVCHNIFNGNNYLSKIVNVSSNETQLLDWPLCAIAPDGTQGYSIDFGYIAKLNPDYGYFCKRTKQDPTDPIAIRAIDIQQNRITASLSMREVLNLNHRQEFDAARHEVNHIAVSPNGDRIMFIHRWHSETGVRKSRLITANNNLSDLYSLGNGEMVSHCTWRNSSQIIGWMKIQNATSPNYYLLDDQKEKSSIVGNGKLNSDGHPTIIDQDWLLTDTYPNRARMSQLLLYNLRSQKLNTLGEFYSPLKFWGPIRCDLHPKYSPESKSVFFESVHTGQRCLYQMDIGRIIDSSN